MTVERRAKKHTYRFTYEGREYARTTHRVYSHAIVFWRMSGGGGQALQKQFLDPCYTASGTDNEAGAWRTARRLAKQFAACAYDLVALPQP